MIPIFWYAYFKRESFKYLSFLFEELLTQGKEVDTGEIFIKINKTSYAQL